MSSVNTSLAENSNIKVSNLYKNLGITKNRAIRPPDPKENPRTIKKNSRRQTMFAPDLPNFCQSFQRFNTLKCESHKTSSTCTEEEFSSFIGSGLPAKTIQKSRFISNWIQNMKRNKENSYSPQCP